MEKTTSFRARLTWSLVLLSAGCLLLLSVAFLVTAVRSIRGHFEEMAADATRISAQYLVATGRLNDLQKQPGRVAGVSDQATSIGTFASSVNLLSGDQALLFDARGTPLLRLSRSGRNSLDSAATELSSHSVELLSGDREAITQVHSRSEGLWVGARVPVLDSAPALALFVHYPMTGANRLALSTTAYVIGLSCALVGAAIALARRLSQYMTQPLNNLSQAAQRIGEGDLVHRISSDPCDEFGQIAKAFNQMASSLQDQMRNVEAEAQHREQLESEFRIAAQLQQSLLPGTLPEVEGLDFAAMSRPARQAGGDFYDICEVGTKYIYFAVGDATNKGLPAAIHITECASAIRALARLGFSPSQVLHHVNGQLYEDLGDSCRFVTLFLARLNLETRTLTYSVAGHNPPVLFRNPSEAPMFLGNDSGLPLGVSDQAKFRDANVALQPGDILLLYTDGLTEAINRDRELLGIERVVLTLRGRNHESATSILHALLSRVEEHDGGNHVDDLTMFVARIK